MHLLRELQKNNIMDSNDGFKIKDKNAYLIFLGDYTDRGLAGIEVIITILRLMLENPNNVFLVRGNHENKNLHMNGLLFQHEVEDK